MTQQASFNWREWYDVFGLAEDVLAEVWPLYPSVLAARQTEHSPLLEELVEMRLSDREVEALLEAEESTPSLEDCFTHYLEEGEIDAATVLVKKVATLRGEPTLSLQRRVSQRQQELEMEFGHLNAQLIRYHRDLVGLGAIAQDQQDLKRVIVSADGLFRLKRLGPGVQLLKRHVAELAIQVEGHRQRLQAQVEKTKWLAEQQGSTAVQVEIRRLVDKAAKFLDMGQLGLAQRTLQRAQVLYETGEAPPQQELVGETEDVDLREEFPDVGARDIVAYFESRITSPTREFMRFLEEWCPEEWKRGRRPSQKNDPTYPIYEAVWDLSRVSGPGSPYPFSQRYDPWRLFLKDLFSLIGKRGLQPDKPVEILTRSFQGVPNGFWLARCSKDLMIPHSFIDPARLPNGLTVVFWHRPNDPLCPKPANLQNELHAKGLSNSPLLFLSGESIFPDDRQALQRALPTATLLDERDLLRIIFCSDKPERRAEHFAQAVARQLPFDQASPYSEQGEVNSAMFVGRQSVLRQLSDPQGITVLYGGRKLGKSSIFRQLQRDFAKQAVSPGWSVAIYVNAINVVDGTGIEHTLLPNIARELNRHLRYARDEGGANILDFWISVDQVVRCDAFADHVRRILQALPNHRFLLLVDEADSLLQFLDTPNDPSISSTKRFGWTLRGLVQESGGRFDVRFAGFQEISRAAQSHSGPFYNFRSGATQLPLTVFDSSEARTLILRPLQLLGVRFEDESLVEMILDLTGQHPALIQDFCRRLYKRVRSTNRSQPLPVRMEDVETIWQEPDFRKSVVRAVHLNVETRNTKREKILRLLLYIWVRQIMAPNGYPAIATICQPIDLYQMLCKLYGEQAVEREIQLAQLDNYMSDLATLGVLEKYGRGYVFRYRYFANLLYYDYFGGQLGDNVTGELWESIVKHEEQPARLQIRAGNDLSVSPFTRLDQEHMEQERRRVMFVLGAPGTGKTEFFHWLRASQGHEGEESGSVRLLDAAALPFEELCSGLSTILDLDPMPASWQAFADQAERHWTGRSSSTLVVLDGVDGLASDDRWPLLEWPTAQDRVKKDDGLLFTLRRLTQASEGQLRFCFTGTFSLTRLWVDTADLLAGTVTALRTERLTSRERDAWFEAAKLIATPEVKQEVWNLTGGDWRLLSTLRDWLRKHRIEEPQESHIREFGQALKPPLKLTALPELLHNLERYDRKVRLTLKGLAALSKDCGTEADDITWSELLVEHFQSMRNAQQINFTQRQWLIELKTAVLLQELATKSDAQTRAVSVVVPLSDTWFQMVTSADV